MFIVILHDEDGACAMNAEGRFTQEPAYEPARIFYTLPYAEKIAKIRKAEIGRASAGREYFFSVHVREHRPWTRWIPRKDRFTQAQRMSARREAEWAREEAALFDIMDAKFG